MPKEFLNVAEVAAAFDLGPVTIYRWCRSGRLPAVKVGKEWRIHRAALAALLHRGARHAAQHSVGEGEPMGKVAPAMQELARQLLLDETGGRREPAALAAAFERAYARLHEQLAGLIGRAGFATLFARALRLAQGEHPTLAGLAVDDGAAAGLRGVREVAAGHDPAVAADALATVLAHFIWLLVTFIGEGLSMRLLRENWPGLGGDVASGAEGEAGK